MRCPDLCSGLRTSALRRRIITYWKQVARQGFRASDPAYRYFAAWDIFHDSEIKVVDVDVERETVKLDLRNVHAVDRVSSWQEQHRRAPALRRKDFHAGVTFHGVTEFRHALKSGRGHPVFHCSALMRRKGMYELSILTQDWPTTRGTIGIVFRRVEIEDIFPRISRYTCGRRPRGLLTWVSRPPEYYLTQEGLKELLPC